MYSSQKRLILASASPRRQLFLKQLGVDFVVAAANIDETPLPGEPPLRYVTRMASEKCREVVQNSPHCWVLAADTTVYLEDEILGKPEDQEEAVEILMRLSGRIHRVATSFVLGEGAADIVHQETIVTEVAFTAFPETIARHYVATGEPLDKAGAYGIQGVGAALVKEVHGSYTNVVGLPLAEVVRELSKYGIVKTK